MKTYRVYSTDGQDWRIAPRAFSVFDFFTSDRRLARRAVRLARRLGYANVKFHQE